MRTRPYSLSHESYDAMPKDYALEPRNTCDANPSCTRFVASVAMLKLKLRTSAHSPALDDTEQLPEKFMTRTICDCHARICQPMDWYISAIVQSGVQHGNSEPIEEAPSQG